MGEKQGCNRPVSALKNPEPAFILLFLICEQGADVINLRILGG